MSNRTRPGIADFVSPRFHRLRSRRVASACIEALEQRQLLSTVTIGNLPTSQAIPQKKSLIVPLSASDSDGLPVTYTVTSSNKAFKVLYHKNPTFVQFNISTQPNAQWSPNQTAITGTLTFELFSDIAPKTVSYITGLVNAGFYNNLQFFRMDDLSGGQGSSPQVILQGGSPSNNGQGGPGFQFEDEFNQNAIFSGTGQLAMANSGPDTNGSQFFFTFAPTRPLDFGYTIFGQLVNSQNTVEGATTDFMTALSNIGFHKQTDSTTQQTLSVPNQTITINSAKVVQDTQDAAVTLVAPAAGGSTITVKATDSKGAVATKTFQVFTKKDLNAQGKPINDPPFLQPSPKDAVVPMSTATNMSHVSFTLQAFDFENDKPVWGGGFLNGTHAYAVLEGNMLTVVPFAGYKGPIILKITASEANSTKSTPDSEIVTIAVGGKSFSNVHGMNVQATAGKSGTFTVASFRQAVSGAKVSNYKATINWGDGQVSNGTIVKGPKGVWTVSGTNTYKGEATYPINVLISDNLGVIAKTVSSATVGDAALTPASPPTTFFGTAGTAFSNLTVGSFTDADTNGQASDFSGTINWGDGSAPGTLTSTNFTSRGSGKFDITAGHTYATAGSYNVTIRVKDQGGASATVTSTAKIGRTTLTVNPGTAPSTFNEGDTLNQAGTFTDTDATITNWTATVDYGDGSAVQNLVLNNKSYTLNHQYLDAGSYTVRVVVTDQNGVSSSGTMSLTVANLPPSMTSLSGNPTAIAQQPYNISFSATDISPKDTSNGFYFKVDWGDGKGTIFTGMTSVTGAFVPGAIVNQANSNAIGIVRSWDPSTGRLVVGTLKGTFDGTAADKVSQTSPSAANASPSASPTDESGSVDSQFVSPKNTTSSHNYAPGTYYIAVSAFDQQSQNGDSSTNTDPTARYRTMQVVVGRSGILAGNLYVGAVAGGDKIKLVPGAAAGQIAVQHADASGTYVTDNTYNLSDITGRIQINGGAGNDLISIDPKITKDAVIIGGGGNDTMTGGGGNDIIVGSSGNDVIDGGGGRNILLGGSGKDSLVGASGQDVLVAGTSQYASALQTLQAYLKEWASNRSYADRVNRLTVPGTAFSAKFILNNKTVTHDTTNSDTLVGGSGGDLYLARTKLTPKDVLKNRKSSETLVEI